MDRVDARASLTPLTILKIGSLLRELGPGRGVEILCDDEATMRDIRRIHPDCEYREIMREKGGNGRLFLLLKQQPQQP